MTNQFSAGGVIVAYKNSTPFVLLLQDKSKRWTFPKGLLEKGEDCKTTAMREIKEEVGLTRLKLIQELKPISYLYRWEGKLVSKTVFYFLCRGETNEKPKPQRSEGIMDAKWWPIEKAVELIGYKKTNAQVLREAQEYLQSNLD